MPKNIFTILHFFGRTGFFARISMSRDRCFLGWSAPCGPKSTLPKAKNEKYEPACERAGINAATQWRVIVQRNRREKDAAHGAFAEADRNCPVGRTGLERQGNRE